MSTITLQGNPFHTTQHPLPTPGAQAPRLLPREGRPLRDFSGRSGRKKRDPQHLSRLDTPVCAASIRRFNQEAASRKHRGPVHLHGPALAAGRFCAAEGIDKVLTASAFRSARFRGRLRRGRGGWPPARTARAWAVVVLNPAGQVTHAQLVPEITQEPDYAAALNA